MPSIAGQDVADRLAPAGQERAGALRGEERAHDADAEDDESEQHQHLGHFIDEELDGRSPAASPQVQHVVGEPDGEGQPASARRHPRGRRRARGAPSLPKSKTLFLLRKYHIDSCLMPADSALVTMLTALPAWKVAYRGRASVLLVHAANPESGMTTVDIRKENPKQGGVH